MSDESNHNEKSEEKKREKKAVPLKEFKKNGISLKTGETYDIELKTKKIKFSM
jgi:hypothetical protein